MARALLLTVLLLAPCFGAPDDRDTGTTLPSEEFPNIVAVSVSRTIPETYRFEVTVSSPYDSPDRYADAWRIMSTDGTVYGIRELLHDHAAEQPFVRSLDEVQVPADVMVVIVQGRDLENGWGGKTVTIDLPPPP